MAEPWTLTMPEGLYEELNTHLFPGDGDEHGAVIAAGIRRSARGTRLLARELFLARDGVDFVPGRRGYRMLTAEFVRDKVHFCRDERLVYLAVHNHGGDDRVGFSEPDFNSHCRGYPALLDISGMPVGALVFAESAIAGDIWTPDRERRTLAEAVLVGSNLPRLYPAPPPPPPQADSSFDRQARWFGDRGQHHLAQIKVGVVGAGGVGLPLVAMLSRIGVGDIVVIDPDRLDPTNLPRLAEASRLDALMPLRRFKPLIPLTERLSRRKVDLARRAARRANPKVRFSAIAENVIEPPAAQALTDCDCIFLAADSHLARKIVNAIAHQYLIPIFQLGTRIDVNPGSGEVGDIRSFIRLVLPDSGCLRCNGLILPGRVQEESIGALERERNRYVDEVPAPSVITFNTQIAAQAVSDFILMTGSLIEPAAPSGYLRVRPRLRLWEELQPIANKASCPDCGSDARSRRGRGDDFELPLPQRR